MADIGQGSMLNSPPPHPTPAERYLGARCIPTGWQQELEEIHLLGPFVFVTHPGVSIPHFLIQLQLQFQSPGLRSGAQIPPLDAI